MQPTTRRRVDELHKLLDSLDGDLEQLVLRYPRKVARATAEVVAASLEVDLVAAWVAGSDDPASLILLGGLAAASTWGSVVGYGSPPDVVSAPATSALGGLPVVVVVLVLYDEPGAAETAVAASLAGWPGGVASVVVLEDRRTSPGDRVAGAPVVAVLR